MEKVKKELEDLKHEVDIPPLEVKDGNGNLISATDYYQIRRKTENSEDWVWERKKWAMKKHFDKVAWSDAILVLNYDKNGIKNYVGANTLMEMGLALYLNKKIYLLNPIPEISYKEEIMGMKAEIINGDLKKIGVRVAVGSRNPVKLSSVEKAFNTVWPNENWIVEGVDVSSGVSNQPMSDEESIKGARSRAKQALEKTGADYGVGQEGGIQKIGNDCFDNGWMIVIDKKGNEGIGSTIKMIVPPKMMALINEGKEVGTANDIIFGLNNSKQNAGHFGTLTNGFIDRTGCYKDGIISALARFIHPELF